MSSISLRREGTVISIALSANMKPTSALTAENSVSPWFSGAEATANSVESKLAGSRFKPGARRDPAERRAHLAAASGLRLDEDARNPALAYR